MPLLAMTPTLENMCVLLLQLIVDSNQVSTQSQSKHISYPASLDPLSQQTYMAPPVRGRRKRGPALDA